MPRVLQKTLILFALAFFFGGCVSSLPKEPPLIPLRVGVFPYYPPMIFKQNGEVRGAEADLAIRLAKALGREAQFIELGWEQLIPALMEGKIDIIMSGMSITEARKARVRFAEPYLKIGLVALMRAEDISKFNSLTSIQESFSTVGVVQGTTSEAFVRRNFLKAANIISFQKASEALNLLITMRIDLFVHDAPSIVWLVSENEGLLKGFWEPFNQEYLGWAINPGDQDLILKANSILSNWKKDGTLKEILTRWLPYWKNFE
jgi:ABC-type amino acid transport substrate-binding protein